MTINPDIVVEGDLAIADVKYKLSTGALDRADFNQIVTFATGYRTPFAAIVDFREPDARPLPTVQIGEMTLAQLSWTAGPMNAPEQAASRLAGSFSNWLRGLRAA